jgi:hypothetical protein
MAVYLGYYRPVPDFVANDAFRRKVVELPEKLPAGCLLIGSYVPTGGAAAVTPSRPAVMLVETDHPADLDFISQYYAGALQFDWVPVTPVGTTRPEREAWAAAVTAAAEEAEAEATAEVASAAIHRSVET